MARGWKLVGLWGGSWLEHRDRRLGDGGLVDRMWDELLGAHHTWWGHDLLVLRLVGDLHRYCLMMHTRRG